MTMSTRAAVATFLLTSAALLLGSDACNSIPSMGLDDLCTKACSTATPPLVQLCKDTLKGATADDATAEITVYAIAAAKQAKASYESTMAKADQLVKQNPSLPAGEKAAYDSCKVKYDTALKLMVGVANQLSLCSFSSLKQEYIDATLNLRGCGDDLAKFPSSPLLDMIASDKKLTMLALDIGSLIVGK